MIDVDIDIDGMDDLKKSSSHPSSLFVCLLCVADDLSLDAKLWYFSMTQSDTHYTHTSAWFPPISDRRF